jgi:hypothetical protein
MHVARYGSTEWEHRYRLIAAAIIVCGFVRRHSQGG